MCATSCVMTLADYLSQHRITQAAFAARVGVAPSTITRICRGQTRPGAPLVTAIVRETAGAVLPNDLFPEAMAQLGQRATTTQPEAA